MTGRRRLAFFFGVQLLGLICGTVRGMFTWLASVLLLFPGFLLAVAFSDILNRVPTPVRLAVNVGVTVACNALFWFACSAAWRRLRDKFLV